MKQKSRRFGTPKMTLAQAQAQFRMYCPDNAPPDRLPAFMKQTPRAPRTTPNKSPEASLQAAIVTYLARCCPAVLVASSGNGASLRGGAIAMARAKRGGLLAGDPDIRLSLPGGKTIYFEIKSETGKLSDAQKHTHNRLEKLGFHVYVIRSIEDLREVIRLEGIPSLHREVL